VDTESGNFSYILSVYCHIFYVVNVEALQHALLLSFFPFVLNDPLELSLRPLGLLVRGTYRVPFKILLLSRVSCRDCFEEFSWKEVLVINGHQIRWVFLSWCSKAWRETRCPLLYINGKACLSWLEYYRFVAIELGRQEDRILNLHKGSEFWVIVFEDVVAFGGLANRCMTARHRYVICYANVTLLGSTDTNLLLSLGVDDIEDFLGDSSTWDGFKDDVVFSWLINTDDIYDSVVVSNLEGEYLLAKLTVKLLELDDDWVLVQLEAPFGFQPTL